MEQKYFFTIVAMIFVAVFAIGYMMSGQSIDVAGCRAEWSQIPQSVQQSELCSSGSCVAQPADQQHNAIVDALACACAGAGAKSYSDAGANSRIQEVTKNYFGFDLSVQQVCGSEGQQFLVRHAYG